MEAKYEFQERALRQIRANLKAGSRVLCVSPTGSGKGTMGARLVQAAVKHQLPAVFIAPRIEIADDICERMQGRGIPASVLGGGRPEKNTLVKVCTIQTLVRASKLPKARMLILDEAHHYARNQWADIATRYPEAATIGFTAFPERADGTKLSDIFDTLVVAAQYSELIENGCIVPCELWRPSNVLGADLAMSALDAYRKHARGQTIVYERSHQHVERTAQEFRDAGINAVGIVDSTPKATRKQAIEDFKSGKLKILVNYLILTEGTNLPTAQTAILCRGFGYISTYIQCVGRVLRSHPGKESGIVLDLSGASHRYDFPDSDRDYSLRERCTQIQGRKFSASLGTVLGLPLGKVIRPDAKALNSERMAFWKGLQTSVKHGEFSLLEARNMFRSKYEVDAPLW